MGFTHRTHLKEGIRISIIEALAESLLVKSLVSRNARGAANVTWDRAALLRDLRRHCCTREEEMKR